MAHYIIQWLNCVVHSLSMKINWKSVEKNYAQFWSALKWERVYKISPSWTGTSHYLVELIRYENLKTSIYMANLFNGTWYMCNTETLGISLTLVGASKGIGYPEMEVGRLFLGGLYICYDVRFPWLNTRGGESMVPCLSPCITIDLMVIENEVNNEYKSHTHTPNIHNWSQYFHFWRMTLICKTKIHA